MPEGLARLVSPRSCRLCAAAPDLLEFASHLIGVDPAGCTASAIPSTNSSSCFAGVGRVVVSDASWMPAPAPVLRSLFRSAFEQDVLSAPATNPARSVREWDRGTSVFAHSTPVRLRDTQSRLGFGIPGDACGIARTRGWRTTAYSVAASVSLATLKLQPGGLRDGWESLARAREPIRVSRQTRFPEAVEHIRSRWSWPPRRRWPVVPSCPRSAPVSPLPAGCTR